MGPFGESVLLLFVLLNPFILAVYMNELVSALDFKLFTRHVTRAALVSLVVFLCFAWAGEAVFEDVLQVHFESFLIFGGLTFLIVGIRLILGIGPAVQALHPTSDQVSAAIAMPLLVGPGTISASVLAGTRLDSAGAAAAIVLALGFAVLALLAFKRIQDWVRARNERLVRRYTEIAGRATALFTGSFAIEMIARGVRGWVELSRG